MLQKIQSPETNREFSLRPVRLSDASEIFALVDESRDSLREFLGWLDHNKTIQDTENFLKLCETQMNEKITFTFSIIKNGSITGLISYHPIDWRNKAAAIGYWISIRYRKQGLAKWATCRVLEHAFKELLLNRIEIRCAIQNIASQKIPESLKFKYEGIKRDAEWLYDRFIDNKIYSLLESEWLANHEAYNRISLFSS
jgi:ribosomal-protein-serine acetyltransferase